MATQDQLHAVQQLYVGYLGRAADQAGLQFWADAIAAGTSTIASVATGFTLSAEYTAQYSGLSNDAMVAKVYNNVLGRAADQEGLQFWVDALTTKKVTADTLVATMITNLGHDDQLVINNKTFVAQTYTNTAGANYNPAGGAAVLVGVDGTAASVSAAAAAITGGTLPGQVPGLALINAADAAQTAQTAFEAANKTTVDALVTKLLAADTAAGLLPAATQADDITPTSDYTTKVAAVVNDAALLRAKVSVDSTTVLTTKVADATSATTAAYAALGTAGQAKADAYGAAVKAEAALTHASGNDVAAVKAGLAADGGFVAALAKATVVDAGITTVDTLYSVYTAGTTTATERAAIDTAMKGDAYYSTFQATAAIDSAKNVAGQLVTTTKTAVDLVDTGTYSADLGLQNTAAKTLANAQAADADVASAAALKTADDAVVKTTTDASTALNTFNATGVEVHTLHVDASTNVVSDSAASPLAGTVNKDVFYFAAADKANIVGTTSDATIGTFGSGDSLVLGNSLTYNSGALSTGDNNKAEFFLVQQGKDTLVVLETAKYGSSDVKVDASGNIAAHPDAAVITLTGVAVTDLTVNNGVISHVA